MKTRIVKVSRISSPDFDSEHKETEIGRASLIQGKAVLSGFPPEQIAFYEDRGVRDGQGGRILPTDGMKFLDKFVHDFQGMFMKVEDVVEDVA